MRTTEGDPVEQALRERNRLAILCVALASRVGMRSGVYEQDGVTYVQFDLPSGHVRFPLNVDDPRWNVFSPAWEMVGDFDGEETEKWTRIERFVRGHAARTDDEIVLASFRKTVLNLEEELRLARLQREDSGRMYAAARANRQDLEATLTNLREVLISTGGVDSEIFDRALEKAEKLTEEQRRGSDR